MTADLQPDVAVEAAARWLAGDPDHTGRAIVPSVKTRFGLTTLESIEAIRLARLLRLQGGAHAKAS